MTIILHLETIRSWMGQVRPSKGLLRAISLGLGAFAVTWAVLPPQTFRAHALLAVADGESPLAGALAKAAAEASVSETVIRRASVSLVGTRIFVPEPAALHRIARLFGLSGAHALARDARLALDLGRMVSAKPGDTPGSLEIAARDPDPVRAAQVAAALADSVIADRDDMAGRLRQKRELAHAAEMENLDLALASARKRLAALGLVVDPSEIKTAAQHAAKAQARADAIHAAIASGTPPMSDHPSPSAAIETLQSTYLTASRQLETARETLGDRHVPVIALQSGVQQAATKLTAQWKRLARLADADLAAARRREAMLRKSDAAMDAPHRAAVEAARRDVHIAETMLARAQAAPVDASNEVRPYWLMEAPMVPNVANGLSNGLRAFIGAITGLLAAEIVLAWPALRNIRLLSRSLRGACSDWLSARIDNLRLIRTKVIDVTARKRADVEIKALPPADDEAVMAILDSAELASNGYFSAERAGVVTPTIMVATNDSPGDTTFVALAIGRAAADAGLRVLIAEARRSRPTLAVAVDVEADPEVVDLLGDLRVVLRAEGTTGDLYLAPSFPDGSRLASTLVRNDKAPLLGDAEAAFDLIVIDGGQATAELAAGWAAESYVRVGSSRSQDDDERFAATFGIPVSTLLETVVPLAPDVADRPIRSRASKFSLDSRWASAPPSGVFVTAAHVPFTRPAGAWRTSGARSSQSNRQ